MDEYLDIIELSDYFSTDRKQEIDMLVIGLVESGFGTIEVEGRKFPIRTNDLIVCPPGDRRHQQEHDMPDDLHRAQLWPHLRLAQLRP